MTTLLKILKLALVTQKTVTAIAATVVISAGVYQYLRDQNQRGFK